LGAGRKSTIRTREQLLEEIRVQKKKARSLEKEVAASRQTADALLQSERNLSSILEASADGTVIVDRDGTVLYANPAAEKLFGIARKDFVGFPFGFPVSADRSEDHITIRTGDRLRDAELRVVQMQWHNRSAFQLAVRDITERKRAEQELRMLSAAMEQSSALVMITSRLGGIEYVNPRFTAVSGFAIEEVLGKNPGFLMSGDKPAEDYRALWQTITSGQEWHGEFQNRKKDGTSYWAQASISPMRDADGEITHFISVAEDITAHKTMEAQLFQAQKMESIGRLAGGVAHDFNNMLQVIGSYAEIAMLEIDSTNVLYGHLVQIREATRRSAELTGQLLAFARKQAISPRVLDLNDTVAGMLKIIRRLIGENIELQWVPGAGVWLVKVDPTQIDQVLANLTVNSRDAISGTGKVTIETTNAVFDEAYCALHAGYIPGDYVLLAVSDNGSGMTRETIAHLFEPFFTTKRLGRGTGLGTATVFGIVKQNKGFISVYSEPGVGTTFRIYLPRFLSDGVAAGVQEVEAAPPRGTETVLIVEDEAAILELTMRMLQSLGYTVLTAGTPGEAIRIAAEDKAEIHLVITDVVMPEMNGRELVERIGTLRPGLKYLFMSWYMANVISQHGELDEGVRFLQKPFSMNDLACKVRETLEP
jgi:two-component system, cell cycle sensor histidine kinase and response regulator CckA